MLENQQIVRPPLPARHSPGDAGAGARHRTRNFDLELAFTNTYRQYQKAHVAIREAMCMRVLLPALLEPIQPGDLFVGRITYRNVGFGLDDASGGPGYYGHAGGLQQDLDNTEVDDLTRKRVEAMMVFWQKEATMDGKVMSSLPAEVQAVTTNTIAAMSGRLSGASLDFAKLVAMGLPGLRAEVEQSQVCALQENGDLHLHAALLMALDLLSDVCHYYARQARDMATRINDPQWYAELQAMSNVLDHIAIGRPATFREGVQLVWLYALVAGVANYGRFDVSLGALYAHDLDAGVLTEDRAAQLLQSLWELIAAHEAPCRGQVTVGGRGRHNEANADRLALAALEATRARGEAGPQLIVRFHTEQNPALMQKALDVLSEGGARPILCNDDVNIPAVRRVFNVTTAEAEQYLSYGCGVYVLDHLSLGSPNGSLSLPKALEVTLTGGRDLLTGESRGLSTGEFRDFATFEAFFDAYKQQIEHHLAYLAQRHELEYRVARESAAFLYLTLLYDDCLLNGKALLEGGVRYLGGVVEIAGMVSAANSLAAIKQLVYEERRLTPGRLLAALTANFAGYEAERQLFLDVSQQDNNPGAEALLSALARYVAETAQRQAGPAGLAYYLVADAGAVTGANLSQTTAASADGRKAGEPFGTGRTPVVGTDCQDVMALLGAAFVQVPPVQTGHVQPLTFSRQLFIENRPRVEALLHAYFAQGGAQTIISVEDDLKKKG
ncbi:MAG: pyruvate formate lyase family protein [Anaerolineae bacterium]|nr:pyruvate formate lyase family protein [Anaerolineae bacterium]